MKEKLQYRDHFGKKIRLENVVAFAKVGHEGKTDKKTTMLYSGNVIELVNKNGEASIKVMDPVTQKISHIRRLENVVVLKDRPIGMNSKTPKYFDEKENGDLNV